jgi:phage shock protein A
MTFDLEKILLGAMPVIAAVLTAMWTLRGKAGDNISSDQAAFRKDLLGRIATLEADNATLRGEVVALKVENVSQKRDVEDAHEEIAVLKAEIQTLKASRTP